MSNPYQVVRDFEAALCEYTGAPYAVAVTSCTMALLLACKWHKVKCFDTHITIPAKTYVSVPMSIKHARFCVKFRDYEWLGCYQLEPFQIWDSARLFTSGMFDMIGNGTKYICTSHHASKTCGDTQGGAILHNDPEADAWFRRMRFDGRTEGVAPKDDNFTEIGYHCYMSPDVAARLMLKLSVLSKHNDPLTNDDYPDLSKMEIFQ